MRTLEAVVEEVRSFPVPDRLRLVERIVHEIAEASAGAAPRERFEALVADWRRETGGWSNPHKIVAHRCYRDIVAMGWDAVPLILADLERNADPDFWGPALREITGETVKIAPADAGRLDLVAKAWLALARKKGWLLAKTKGA